MLASEYHPGDALSAEFIRTCQHHAFYGGSFLSRVESLRKRDNPLSEFVNIVLPRGSRVGATIDYVSLSMDFDHSFPTVGLCLLMSFPCILICTVSKDHTRVSTILLSGPLGLIHCLQISNVSRESISFLSKVLSSGANTEF